MRTITHSVAGDPVTIHYPERRADLAGFDLFLAQGDKVLGFDTETSDLNIYAPGHRLRLAQFGNDREAWVLRADLFPDAITRALRQPRAFAVHNAPFDLLVIDHHLGVKVEELADRVVDTRILAHLNDPRQPHEGGIGLRLKPLSEHFIDPDAPDTEAGLVAEFRKMGLTKATGWARISADNETYVRYAGLDVILERRLFDVLGPIIKERGLSGLSKFEHHLQSLVILMQRRGLLLDVDYVNRLVDELTREAEQARATARLYGVENVNSTDQVAAALLGMGETLTERTGSGKWKVDKAVMLPLADLNPQWQRLDVRDPNPLADAVLHAKRAEKWAATYGQAFLDLKDANDRLHPTIGTLQARTARMSVSNPPLQQLPSSDWRIRRAIIADPGYVIASADYSQVEMRVLAALCEDAALVEAIKSGTDLHSFTAERVFGAGFTKQQRAIAKAIGFGKVYGGGKATIARQTGAPIDDVAEALAAYDRVFPGIKRFARKLQDRLEYGRRAIITPAGRHLPVDRDRSYSATNYLVQSTARDLLAQAIVDIHDAGLGDYLLLPIHDEVLFQAPAKDADEVAAEIGRLMASTFRGIPITTDAEVYGWHWGMGYSAPEEADPR